MILEAEDLKVQRGGVPVLDIPSLALRTGGVLALIGPNGSGKSTLLQTLAGLQEPASGRIRFQGRALDSRRSLADYRQRVTMVFQESLLFDTTVAGNLESGLKLRHLPAAARRLRVEEVAGQFGIAHLLGRQARKLSGGEAQRASLARAFAIRPEILFLDEPFSALDPPTREALIDDLALALRQTRTTTVMATHDQMEALRLADTLAVMHQGRIVQTGAGIEVLNQPADAFVAGFVGMETLIQGVVTECHPGLFHMAVDGREVEAAGEARVGEAVLVGIRPENVTLALGHAVLTSARNSFPGTVQRILPRGPFFKVELDCGFFLAALVTPESLETLGLAPGQELVASFKATATHCLRNRPVNI
jgi:tungstate transport system ATP-binding protein